jgi:hypothetical protein
VVVEPPGQSGSGGVAKVDDRHLPPVEILGFERVSGAVVFGSIFEGFATIVSAIKCRKQRGRGGAVEAAAVE